MDLDGNESDRRKVANSYSADACSRLETELRTNRMT